MRTLASPQLALALALVAGSLGTQAHAQNSNLNKSVPAAQAPLTAQERLDAIRQSLVDASLQTPTRVSTTSWVDPQGSLRENSRFQNSMDVRGVRISGFERDETGQAKARLQFPNSPTVSSAEKNSEKPITETGLKGAVQKFNKLMVKATSFGKFKSSQDEVAEEQACTPKMSASMNHIIDFGMDIDPSANRVVLQSVLPLLQSQWVESTGAEGQARAWRAVNNLPAASMSNKMSAYERALIGNRPDVLPWQATLKIRTASLAATGFEGMMGQPNNSVTLNLTFQLASNEGHVEKYEESASLQLEVSRPAWSAPSLTQASLNLVQQQLQTWRADAEQWLSCHAINPAVTAVNAQQLQINAGALAGVRKGDELLVANPARFPKELLSKEGAPQTLLAHVQSVTPYNSQLVVLAGPAQAVQADWRAWPTDTLVKEPKVAPTAQTPSATAKRSVKTAANANASFVMNPY